MVPIIHPSHRHARCMRQRSMSLVGLLLANGAVGTALEAQSAKHVVANVCAELEASPSTLVRATEGLALLRLKRELESAAFTLEHTQQWQDAQLQQFTRVQRGVDSLMGVIVRYTRDQHGNGETITIRQGDSVQVATGGHTPESRGIEPRGAETRTFVATMDGRTRVFAPRVEATIRALQPQIAALTEAAESQLRMRSSSRAGYMGIGLSGAQLRLVTPEGVMISHCEYPMVETVDGGSPAARAGLSAGDTVLSYNGRDLLQQAVNYSTMLVPGQSVRLRILRAGRARDVPVAVTTRPEAQSMKVAVTSRAVPSAPLRAARMSPAPTAAPPLLNGTGVAVYAGAQFSAIDDEFAQRVGLEPGLLVLRVLPGSPASDAGLRAGDVVRAVNGTAVRELRPLARAFNSPGVREVSMQVHGRDGPARTVTVRW